MANRYIGMNYGQHEQDIVEGAATVAKDVELKFNDNGTASKKDIYQIMTMLQDYLVGSKTTYPKY